MAIQRQVSIAAVDKPANAMYSESQLMMKLPKIINTTDAINKEPNNAVRNIAISRLRIAPRRLKVLLYDFSKLCIIAIMPFDEKKSARMKPNDSKPTLGLVVMSLIKSKSALPAEPGMIF